jgi:nucleoside phosphorylase
MTPDAMLAWRRGSGLVPDGVPAPEAAIITYQAPLFRRVLEQEATTRFALRGSVGRIELLDRSAGRVAAVGDFGFGAPVAAIVVENLIALGVRRFVSMGTAGGLLPGQAFGDVVLCTAAIRDEGVSHHYVAPARRALPSAPLTERLGLALGARGVSHRRGTSWTIDCPYMETDAEVVHYRQEGVCCVEMEASALFSVAQHRRVDMASAFAISDEVGPDGWKGGFAAPEVASSLWAIFQASVDCLVGEDSLGTGSA